MIPALGEYKHLECFAGSRGSRCFHRFPGGGEGVLPCATFPGCPLFFFSSFFFFSLVKYLTQDSLD